MRVAIPMLAAGVEMGVVIPILAADAETRGGIRTEAAGMQGAAANQMEPASRVAAVAGTQARTRETGRVDAETQEISTASKTTVR